MVKTEAAAAVGAPERTTADEAAAEAAKTEIIAVTGVFPDRTMADKAMGELARAGFRPEQIEFTPVVEPEPGSLAHPVPPNLEAKGGAMVGGLIGAVLGLLVGGLVGASYFGNAAVGGILGAMAGVVVAGGFGTLIGWSLTRNKFDFYQRDLHSGRTIIRVQAGGPLVEAAEILRRNGADVMELRAAPAPMTTDFKRLTNFLVEIGVEDVVHTNKSYLAHLIGVYRLMEAQGCSAEACRAGLYHSIYGTELFQGFKLPLDRRADVRALIGERPERLAYLNCAADRASLDQAIRCDAAPYRIVDRLTGEAVQLSGTDFDDLCRVHLFDWLEQVPRSGKWDYRRDTYRRMADRLGQGAREVYDRTFAQASPESQQLIGERT